MPLALTIIKFNHIGAITFPNASNLVFTLKHLLVSLFKDIALTLYQ